MQLNRRQMLKGLGATGVAGGIALNPIAGFAKEPVLQGINYKQLFNQALKNNPRLIGFANVEGNFAKTKLLIEGKVPADLQGMFLRNGPAKSERGDMRYHHYFEGDGMIQKFSIRNGEIWHQGRFIETDKYVREEQENQFLYSGPDTKVAASLPVPGPDVINTANTNVIPVGDDLWALWEAGSPSRIDPETLAFEKQVNLGDNSRYGDSLKSLPFSAHPKIEANGDIWNFGLNPSGHAVIYHLNSAGRVKQAGVINCHYKGGVLHDFLVTEKHVLLILPSLTRNPDPNSKGFFGKTKFDNNLPMRVMVIRKSDLKLSKTYELPSGWVFHFGNAWEEKDGTIRFDGSIYPNINVLHKLGAVMKGDIGFASERSKFALFTLKPNGQSDSYITDRYSEFPRISNHLTGLKNRYTYCLSSNSGSLWSNTVSVFDSHTEAFTDYSFGKDFLVEEHVIYNPSQKEGEGYLLGTALHVPSQRSCLNIFNARRLSDGPVARAWLEHHLPLGFHGNFVAA